MPVASGAWTARACALQCNTCVATDHNSVPAQAQLQAQRGSGTLSEQNYQDTIEKLLAEVWKERLVRKLYRLGRHCAISCNL